MNSPHLVSSRFISAFAISLLLVVFTACNDQKADSEYNTNVDRPAYQAEHPKVLFDQAHNNIHTANGTYKPFVELIESDGYAVAPNNDPFSPEVLAEYDILVISNPKGKEHKYDPAFTVEECDAVEEWVRKGGNLFLIADHYPIGSATQILSEHFGVNMSCGFTNDSLYADPSSRTESPVDGNSELTFSRENGLLGDHSITQGRDSSERISRIISFTGQSLKGPQGSVPFLNLAESSYDVVPDSIWEEKEWVFFTNTYTRFADPVSAAGRSQCVALEFGNGRVVVLGEAAMLTAQVVKDERFGMQVPGIDNRQLALNIMHWLSRLL